MEYESDSEPKCDNSNPPGVELSNKLTSSATRSQLDGADSPRENRKRHGDDISVAAINAKLAPNLGINLLLLSLPLLDKYAHSFSFQLRTPLEFFDALDTDEDLSNGGKRIVEELDVVGTGKATYMVYREKTIISIANKNSCHKLDDYDGPLTHFLNQRREFLLSHASRVLVDATVPAIQDWIVLQCDINVDQPYSGFIKLVSQIEFKELGLLVKEYKKRINYKKFERFEVTVYPVKTFRDFILDVLHPNEYLRRQNEQLEMDRSHLGNEVRELELRLGDEQSMYERDQEYHICEEKKLRARVQNLEQQVLQMRETTARMQEWESKMRSELRQYKTSGIFIHLNPSEIQQWHKLSKVYGDKLRLKVSNVEELVRFLVRGELLRHRRDLESA